MAFDKMFLVAENNSAPKIEQQDQTVGLFTLIFHAPQNETFVDNGRIRIEVSCVGFFAINSEISN